MRTTTPLLGAVLCSLLLMTACSHPLPKLAYPDGSNRIPINPAKAGVQKPAEAPGSSS